MLIVVGSGIKSISHLTEETKKIISEADKVLFLVNENNLKSWLIREAKASESLETIYLSTPKRVDAYHRITDYILETYQQVKNLCVVFYGHPTVFATSALNAVKKIREQNGKAVILPAVSALDCLFADLQIDPGDQGCFSIDATELLIYERNLDINAHIILWQIANLGMHDTQQTTKLEILADYLSNYYSNDQLVCIYEAAILPTQKTSISWLKLAELKSATVTPISTLYIPPSPSLSLSKKYMELLEMDVNDFKLSTQLNTPAQ